MFHNFQVSLVLVTGRINFDRSASCYSLRCKLRLLATLDPKALKVTKKRHEKCRAYIGLPASSRFILLMVQKSGINSPVDMVNIPLCTGFYTSQVVQDFFHQRYWRSLWNVCILHLMVFSKKSATDWKKPPFAVRKHT